jgi:hypothetical protein
MWWCTFLYYFTSRFWLDVLDMFLYQTTWNSYPYILHYNCRLKNKWSTVNTKECNIFYLHLLTYLLCSCLMISSAICLILSSLVNDKYLKQYDWLWSGHMIIKEMFYIPIKFKPELACASMTTSDVSNQWRSNFQQQII